MLLNQNLGLGGQLGYSIMNPLGFRGAPPLPGTFLLIFGRGCSLTHPFGDGQGRHSNEQVE